MKTEAGSGTANRCRLAPLGIGASVLLLVPCCAVLMLATLPGQVACLAINLRQPGVPGGTYLSFEIPHFGSAGLPEIQIRDGGFIKSKRSPNPANHPQQQHHQCPNHPHNNHLPLHRHRIKPAAQRHQHNNDPNLMDRIKPRSSHAKRDLSLSEELLDDEELNKRIRASEARIASLESLEKHKHSANSTSSSSHQVASLETEESTSTESASPATISDKPASFEIQASEVRARRIDVKDVVDAFVAMSSSSSASVEVGCVTLPSNWPYTNDEHQQSTMRPRTPVRRRSRNKFTPLRRDARTVGLSTYGGRSLPPQTIELQVHGGPELSGDSLSLSLVDHSSEGTTTTMNPIAEKLLDLTRSIMQASKTQAPVSQPKNSMYARTPHQLHPMVTGQIVPQRSQNLLRNAPSASAPITSNDVNPDKTMPKNVDMQHLKEIFREALRVLEAPETKTPIPSAANTPSNPELRLKLRLVPTPSPRVPHHLHHHQQHNPIPNHKGNNPLAQYTLRYSPSRGSARNPPPPTVRTMVVPIKKIPPPSPKPSQKMAFTVVIPSKIHIPTTSKPKILSPKETKASGKFLALVKPKPPPPKPTQPRAKPTTNAKTTPRKTPIVTTTTMTKKRAQETRKPSSISIVTSQKSSPKVREMKIITTRPTESTFEELLNKATQGDFLDLTDRKRHFLKPSIRHTLMPISPETSAKMQRNNKPHQANNKNNNNKKPPSSEFLVRAASNHHQSSSDPSSTITPSTETPTTISTTMHPVTGAHRRRLEYKSFPMQPIIGSHNPSLEFYFQTPVPPSVVYTVGSGSRYGVLDPRVQQQNVAHPFFGSSATSSFLLPELTFEPSTITSTTESTTTSTTSSTSPTTTESAKQPEKTGEDSMNNIKFMYPSMTPIITRIQEHHPPEAVISNLMMEHPDNYAYHNNPPASVAEEILPSGHQEPVIHSDVPGMEEYSDYYDGTAMMTTSASPVNVIYHAKPSPGVRKRFRGNRKRDRNFLMRKYWGSSSANNKNSGDYPQHPPGFFETRQRRKISGRHQGRRRVSPPLMRPMSGGHRRHSGVELPKPEHLLEALQRPVAVLPLQFKRDATATGGGSALQRRGFHRKDLYNRATASAAAVMAAPARIRPLLRRPNYFKRSMLMSPLAKAVMSSWDD